MNRVGHVLKSGRTSFYQSNVVRDLFGNVLRPGGLVLASNPTDLTAGVSAQDFTRAAEIVLDVGLVAEKLDTHKICSHP